jgi:hypothetical protein
MLAVLEHQTLSETAFTTRLKLRDGAQTTLHIARYPRARVRPRIAVFRRATPLAAWCQRNNVPHAMGGGFFCRQDNRPLGETWVAGQKHDFSRLAEPWHRLRGSLYVDDAGRPRIAERGHLPSRPKGDLLQAGPVLVRGGQSVIVPGQDSEGFSQTSHQFDSDITAGRYPRAAIGLDRQYIWSVVCDGYNDHDSGLSFAELAEVMRDLGATDALNLDGGGSASLVSDYELINSPRTHDHTYPTGRAIFSAILFQPRSAS